MDARAIESWPFVGRAADLDLLHQTLEDPAARALVITAAAGTGKTRLARQATGSGTTPPMWIQAAPAVTAVPFGALAHVAGLTVEDPSLVYRLLADEADRGDGIIVLDDAPHLDARTSDILHRLSDAGSVTIIATARAGVEVPPWLEWLWLGEGTRHLELGPLAGADIGGLVEIVLGTSSVPQREEIVASLVERTKGNALFVRELVLDLRDRQSVDPELALDASAPPHLLRVLQARLDAGGDVEVPVRVASALGDVPLTVLRQHATDGQIDAAEAGGWLTIDASPRPVVRPAHPLYAEAALAGMTTIERSDLTEAIAQSMLAASGATAGERLGATVALVDLGADVDIAHVVDAARIAFSALDHDLAARLGQRAIEAGDRFEAFLVLGAAHSGAGRGDEAEEALRTALAAAATDDERARSVGRLSVHLVAFGGRIDEAAALLDEIEPLLTDPAARSFVAADRAKLASIRGDLTAVASDLPEDADDLTRLNAAIVGAYLEAMAGDAAACRATIQRALPLADAHKTILPWSSELVRFSGPFAALLEAGPNAAEAEARAGGSRTGRAAEATSGTWRFLTGFAAAIAGRLEVASRSLDQAIDELDGHDLINAQPVAIAARAWVAAQAGDVDHARAHLDRCVDAAASDGRVRTQVAVADVWCDATEARDRDDSPDHRATGRLVEAAREAADGAQPLTAVIVLNELIRLGDPASALASLEPLAHDLAPSWFVRFVTDRARAEHEGDEDRLLRLARRAHGRWPLAAAELHAARARLAGRRRDDEAAARASVQALLEADALGTSRPVSLAEVASPLTRRELNVARLVSNGMSNRAAADQAEVSVRTVENQLQSVYRKLALGGRGELVALLATPQD